MATTLEPVKKHRKKTKNQPSTTATQKSSVASEVEGEVSTQASVIQKIIMTIAVVFPFLGFVATIAMTWSVGWMGWLYLNMLIVGWMLGGIGITIGFHRLLSHRSFEACWPVRAFWVAMGSMAVQGSPLVWCAVHRRHHEMSDHEGDPHSPHVHDGGWFNALKGFIHAHMGWLFAAKWITTNQQRYVPDLTKDRMLVMFDKTYFFWVFLSLVIPLAIGGLVTMTWQGALLGFIWGGLARVFVVHHVTWCINSVCHVFGQREFESGDHSRNNLICGILAHGEGWHNNHHAFPTSARHGLKWWQFDISWLIIRAMQFCGLVWNVKLPSENAMAAKRLA